MEPVRQAPDYESRPSPRGGAPSRPVSRRRSASPASPQSPQPHPGALLLSFRRARELRRPPPRASPAGSHRPLRPRKPRPRRWGMKVSSPLRSRGCPDQGSPVQPPAAQWSPGWTRRELQVLAGWKLREQPHRELRAQLGRGPQRLEPEPADWPRRSLRPGRPGSRQHALPVPRRLQLPDGRPPASYEALDGPVGQVAQPAECAPRLPRSPAAPPRRSAPGPGRPTRAGASAHAPAKRGAGQGSRFRGALQTPRSRRSS
jgi:hypothetical protein